MAGMMQKAQKMQEDMQKAQEEIKSLNVVGSAAGGAVEISLTGEHIATNIKIDSSVMDDQEMLEDLILTAINDANQKIANTSAEKMKAATGGMKLPGGMNLPF